MGYKLIIVTRKNLNLSKGKLAAQVGHASVDCALKSSKYDKKAFDAWYKDGQKKAVVKVNDEKEFYKLKAAAEGLGLTTSLIKDAGHTEIPPGTITVLGIGPGKDGDVDRVAGHLSLL